jgi:hypothetical protein
MNDYRQFIGNNFLMKFFHAFSQFLELGEAAASESSQRSSGSTTLSR